MFERPQYITPDGFKRLPKKSFVKKHSLSNKTAKKTVNRTDIGISKESAKIIALTIKEMLKN